MLAMPLSEIQQKILGAVVDQFLKTWQPSERKKLILQCKDPDAIDELAQWSLLKPVDNSIGFTYAPTALSFHYCGDVQKEALARRSIETVVRLFRRLFPEDKPDLTEEGLEKSLAGLYDEPDKSLVLRVGLYLAPYFSVMNGWTGGYGQHLDIRPTGISERVVKLRDGDIDGLWEKYVRENIPWPRQDSSGGIIPGTGLPLELVNEEVDDYEAIDRFVKQVNSRKVFVVHGHDHAAKDAVARLLEKLHLEAVVLHEQANKGRTIIEKFEAHSEEVAFAVVLLTPDDLGASSEQVGNLPAGINKRARQNVVFELGYFIGKLKRRRVCALYVDGVERPSDMEGLLYVRYDQGGAWRTDLAREIKAAGIDVDLNLLS